VGEEGEVVALDSNRFELSNAAEEVVGEAMAHCSRQAILAGMLDPVPMVVVEQNPVAACIAELLEVDSLEPAA
jgi:hypothetical protein